MALCNTCAKEKSDDGFEEEEEQKNIERSNIKDLLQLFGYLLILILQS